VIGGRLAGAAALGLVGGLSLAVGAPAATSALFVHVMTVHATEHGPSDEQLAPLRPRLRRLVGYRAFRVVQEERRQCTWRNSEAFALPGGRWLQLLPKGMDDQTVMMQVRLLDGRRRLVDSHVRLRNGGTMAFGVGRDGRAGDDDGALIILLRAEE
jgi:hypothetical protein